MYIDIDQTLPLLDFRIICIVCYLLQTYISVNILYRYLKLVTACRPRHIYLDQIKSTVFYKSLNVCQYLKVKRSLKFLKILKKEDVILSESFLFAFAHINELDKR